MNKEPLYQNTTPRSISNLFSHNSICPESLIPLKKSILRKLNSLDSIWKDYYSARPEVFSDAQWVSWSTPQEIVTQLWEWKPLQNIRLLTETIFSNQPSHIIHYLFLVVVLTIILFISFYMLFKFSLKTSTERDKELFSLILIQKITKSFKRPVIFPSPNQTKAEMQSKMISAHSVGKFTLCLT